MEEPIASCIIKNTKAHFLRQKKSLKNKKLTYIKVFKNLTKGIKNKKEKMK